MRAIAETEIELSEAVLASGDDEPESEPSGAYTTDVVFPPGETIRELMAERGMTTDEFHDAMGICVGVSGLPHGQTRIRPGIAQRLELIFNVPAQVWLNLDAAYVRWLESKRA